MSCVIFRPVCWIAVRFFNGGATAGVDHESDDAFWADAAALLPGFDGVPAEPGPSSQSGQWGSVIGWPHVPVSAAMLPNGKLARKSHTAELALTLQPIFADASSIRLHFFHCKLQLSSPFSTEFHFPFSPLPP